MKLSVFLEDRAGLTGRKLEAALKACDENFVETIQELHELKENNLSEMNSIHARGLAPGFRLC